MAIHAALRNDLVVSSTEIDGATVYNIKDPITGKYFRLREPEYWIAQQFDGQADAEVVAEDFTKKFGFELSSADVDKFADNLSLLFFLQDARSEQEVSRRSYGHTQNRSLFSRLLFIKLKAFDPTKVLKRLLKIYRPFHNLPWFVFQMIVIFTGVSLLSANFSFFAIHLTDILQVGSLLAVIISFFVLVTLHEFAHAIICVYYGGEVRSMGFLFLYFQPCAYTDLSDAWMFKKKANRLAVTWAGPYFQLIFIALSVIVWRVTVVGTFVNELARISAIVSWVTFVFNFNPLIKLDGYYLLSDWLDIPNLRSKAFGYFWNVIKRKWLGWPIAAIKATRRETKIFLWYASLSLIYSILLLSYVLYLISAFLLAKTGPGGLVLFAMLLLFTLKSNVADFFKGVGRHIIFMKELFKKPLRLSVYLIILITFGILFFAIPFPHRVSGEVSVRPLEEFSLTLTDLGYLESRYRRGGIDPESKASFLQMSSNEMGLLELVPLVKDGQKVAIGDTLAIVSSSQVAKDVAAEAAELERLEGKLELLKAPPKEAEIEEARTELQAAQASYDKFFRELERSRELKTRKLISSEEVETAESAVEIAKASRDNKQSRLDILRSPPRPEEEAVLISEINSQRAKLDFLKHHLDAQQIISPINGIAVTSSENKEIMAVLNRDKIEVLIPVTDFDINLIKMKQFVQLKIRSFPSKTFDGLVVHIPQGATVTNGNEANFLVSAIVGNVDEGLAGGMTGYAKIEIGRLSLASLLMRKVASTLRVEFWSWW